MPEIFSDPPLSLLLILGIVTLVAGFVWFRRRSRATLVTFLVVLALAVIWVGLSIAVQSPREQAVSRLKAMQAATNSRDWTEAFRHVSANFRYKSLDKDGFRKQVEAVATQYNVTISLQATDRDDVETLPGGEVRIGFAGQGTSPTIDRAPVYIRATFARDPDGEYRLRTVAFFDYIRRKDEISVPGL